MINNDMQTQSFISNATAAFESLLTTAFDSMVEAAGPANVANAGANAYADAMLEGLISDVKGQDMPQAMKDDVIEQLESAFSTSKVETTAEAEAVVDEHLQEQIDEKAKVDVMEVSAGASKEAAGAGGGGNWLVQLAKALGQLADKHLQEMISLSEQLNGANGDAAIGSLTGMMNAEGQMFKLMQETMTTVVKTSGEALHSTARKQ